jgi:hypothetical protein
LTKAPRYAIIKIQKRKGNKTMRVEKTDVKAIILEIEEYQAMEKVIEVLEELEHKFGTENSLMSAEDGELVGIAELPRVRGILDAFRNHRCWEIHPQYFDGIRD